VESRDRFFDQWLSGEDNACVRAIKAMREALKEATPNEYVKIGRDAESVPIRHWHSTLDYIETHCQGFYGMTAIVGEKGAGKTLLALGSAIEAAASGDWQVAYMASEDDEGGLAERFNRYLDAHPHAEDCIGNFHPITVGRGQTPTSIMMEVMGVVNPTYDTPVLTVFDSINSMVNLSNMSYLDGLKEFGLWAMLARRMSQGDASFMITHESNKAGNAKGEVAEFWSDMVLKIKKVKKSAHCVTMRLDKTRRTGGEGDFGNKLLRNWQKAQFEMEAFQPKLYAVNDANEEIPF
jgi:predicted ATP-dependent serine protease